MEDKKEAEEPDKGDQDLIFEWNETEEGEVFFDHNAKEKKGRDEKTTATKGKEKGQDKTRRRRRR